MTSHSAATRRRKRDVALSRLKSCAPAATSGRACASLPGTPEKIQELRRRARRRQAMRCEGDVLADPSRALRYERRGNNALVAVGEARARRDPGEAPRLAGEPFAARLARLMARRGMTRKALAAATGVGLPAISHWAGGRCLPQLPQLIRLADALGVTLDELAGRRGVPA